MKKPKAKKSVRSKLKNIGLVALFCAGLSGDTFHKPHSVHTTENPTKIADPFNRYAASHSFKANKTETKPGALNYILELPLRIQNVHHKYVDKYGGVEDSPEDASRHTEAMKELTEQETRLSGSTTVATLIAAAAGILNEFAGTVYEIYEISTNQSDRTLKQVWNSLTMDIANNCTGICAGLTGKKPSSFPNYVADISKTSAWKALKAPSELFNTWLGTALRGSTQNRSR